MDKETFMPRICPQTDPENGHSSESGDSFTASFVNNLQRSKSLSCISPDKISLAEVSRIKERLLRINPRVETSTLKNFSRSQKLTLTSLALVDFMSFCSTSLMAPFFPKEASDKGMSETFTGFVFSFYALVMFMSSPLFGKFIPRFGPKFLFLLGMFTAGSCNILFGLLQYIENYSLFTILCLLIRGFEALGASAYSTASFIFVVNSFPNNIGSVIGILELFIGLGMSVGPVLGGLLYSLGGFGLPFFTLGIAMVIICLLNILLLPSINGCDNISNRTASLFKLIKIPDVIVKGLVVIVISNVWAFLEPTLEPHLRDFHLTPTKVGLIFLLMAVLYGISSPLWGWIADKVNNHWSMMVIGLVWCTIGLLMLGPSPIFHYPKKTLWLDLLALSLIGFSVALALMPTFQGILSSAIDAGHSDSIGTYSLVAGIWSCMYSFGEVIGPALGGFLLDKYGFPIASTVMAVATFGLAVFASFFFMLSGSSCRDDNTSSDSGISESWRSSFGTSDETTPLLMASLDQSRKSRKDYKQYYKENYVDLLDDKSTITVSVTGKGSSEI